MRVHKSYRYKKNQWCVECGEYSNCLVTSDIITEHTFLCSDECIKIHEGKLKMIKAKRMKPAKRIAKKKEGE